MTKKFEVSRNDETILIQAPSGLSTTVNKYISEVNIIEYKAHEVFSLIDLTTLDLMDNEKKVSDLITLAKMDETSVAAICVYPKQIENVKRLAPDIRIASVAAGFPASQLPLELKLKEIEYCLNAGAGEIDIVVSLPDYFDEKYQDVYEELRAMSKLCHQYQAKLKVILETGAIEKLEDIYCLSLMSLNAGADFIKTSTGKNSAGASKEAVVTMCLALKDFQDKMNILKSIKPSGGIRNLKESQEFLSLISTIMGPKYINNEFVRIGASSLAKNLMNDSEDASGSVY